MYFMNANEMALAIVASKINLEAAEESVVLRALAGRSEPEELPRLRRLAERAALVQAGKFASSAEVHMAMGMSPPVELSWNSSLRSSCGRD